MTGRPFFGVVARGRPGMNDSNLYFRLVVLAVLLCCGYGQAFAFDDPVATCGPLTLRIEGPANVSVLETPYPVRVLLRNDGPAPLRGELRLGVIAPWRIDPSAPAPFQLAPGEEKPHGFSVSVDVGACNGHYPIHAWARFEDAGAAQEAHAVLLVETALEHMSGPASQIPWTPLALTPNGAIPLWSVPVRRGLIRVFAEPETTVLPPGWEGIDERTRAMVMMNQQTVRGDARESVGMHPPWAEGRAGTVAAEFPVSLPEGTSVRLRFAVAIRDHDAARGEPPSDGVMFRVRALPFDAPDGAWGDVLWERHTDSKAWEDAEIDLRAFAGKTLRLQLECHPGPRNDTTCDAAYWGRPLLVTQTDAPSDAAQPPAYPARTLAEVRNGGLTYQVAVQPGVRGLLDGTFSFVSPENALSFTGLRVRVLGDDLHAPHCFHQLTYAAEQAMPDGRVRWLHRFDGPLGPFDLVVDLWLDACSLRARCSIENAPEPKPWQAVHLEGVSAGPWTGRVTRVYAGAGNVLDMPEAFELGFDGHQLATSFVGFEFENDAALVQAVDTPPLRLEVRPSASIATLHAGHAPTLAFIPAPDVWTGVRAWREVNGLRAAGGVPRLAGRFVFDLWGGRYGESADALDQAFRYGLTGAAVVWHNWQRWGYDYRLPDIFPPNPALGTREDFARLVQTCKDHGVLFAPHDNYIDLYPDAEQFTYDNVAFTRDGQPVRAWLNAGRGAQSYRWRTDRVQPFLERNVRRLRDAYAPTAYFIDVWSSIRPYDYWTKDGRYFDCVYTRNAWGGFFAWIRECLGNDAPQISESGHDQLIGFLDGAQANHLRVEAEPQGQDAWFVWRVRCRDAERVPWFDMAHHGRFVLHGAGYDPRYRAGLDPALHGIYSDDYVSTEVLTGHPGMVADPFGRDVVRKYWLLHGLMRALAHKRIDNVAFVDGDIHRQYVRWEGGGEVWVNRSDADWPLEARVLPPYGFHARIPQGDGYTEAAIERRGGAIVDWSRGTDGYYVNARPDLEQREVDFGAVRTGGAVRVRRNGNTLELTALPESQPFTVRVVWQELMPGMPLPASASELDEQGNARGEIPVELQNGVVSVDYPASALDCACSLAL